MKDIDKELSTILRKVVLFDEKDKLETELIENIKELFKESVPLDGTVMPKIAEIDFGINELENIKDYLDDNDIYFVNQRIAELEKKKSNFTV